MRDSKRPLYGYIVGVEVTMKSGKKIEAHTRTDIGQSFDEWVTAFHNKDFSKDSLFVEVPGVPGRGVRSWDSMVIPLASIQTVMFWNIGID